MRLQRYCPMWRPPRYALIAGWKWSRFMFSPFSLGERIAVETVLAGGLWRAHADPNQLEVAILTLRLTRGTQCRGAVS